MSLENPLLTSLSSPLALWLLFQTSGQEAPGPAWPHLPTSPPLAALLREFEVFLLWPGSQQFLRVELWVGADKQLPELPDCTIPGERRRLSLVINSLPHLGAPIFSPSVLLPQAHSRNIFPVSHSTVSALSLEPAPLVPSRD